MTIKCIRCGKKEVSAAKYVGVWDIKYGPHGTLYDNEHFVVGLCPDCQLPEKGTVLAGELLIEEEILKLKEKIVKLECETDRIWEMIQRLGSIIE